MGETTHISWADHTFNPWIGCTKVSPGCDACYAEHLMATRLGRVEWGPHGERKRTSPANWKQPLAWNKAAREADRRAFVFCASLADVFDNQVPAEWRADLFALIHQTPRLTWLLLTKRPQNIERLFNAAVRLPTFEYANLWPINAAIGCTIVDQAEADRDVPVLLSATRALNPLFTFVSMEPLLGPVDLTRLRWSRDGRDYRSNALTRGEWGYPQLDWVITGGETDQGGHKARPSCPQWFRDLRDQCADAGIAYHHKQNGEWASVSAVEGPGEIHTFPDQRSVRRVGKARAGRTLDGQVHDARPNRHQEPRP